MLGSPDDVSALELVDGELRYYEHRYPVAPGTGEGTPQEVHERQHYRLVHWRRGNAELTYRRFFDVSDLAAVRVDDPAVFDATHAEVLRWRAAGQLDGLRIDHPDGLSAPGAYLRRLRAALGDDAWLLVEKILGPDETLPLSWPADGTTGYEALREIGGLFVDPRGEALVDAVTAEHTGVREGLSPTEHAARRLVTDEILVAEVRRIAALVPGDDDPEKVRDAVAELLCSFPVYRSYLPEGRSSLDRAADTAATARPELAEIVRTIHAAMLAEPDGALTRRIEQTSGMVTAKGVEDTTFYRWNRFVALNEVGGAPDRFGVAADRVPRPRRGPGRRDPGDHDHALDARHQALRGRPRAARRAQRAHRRVGRLPAHGVGAPSPSPRRRWSCSPGSRCSGRGRSPRSASRAT